MKIAGIDPSITSSGKVIMELDRNLEVTDIQFYGYQPHLNAQLETDHVHIMCSGTDYTKIPMLVRQDRAMAILDRDMEDVRYVSFEDYAYEEANRGQSNSVFQIGEFCGIARRHFYLQGKGVITYGITQIKHFATGDGEAKKPAMCEAMRELYPQFYFPEFDQFPKQYDSPHSDLCDAFWMCEILRNHMKLDIFGPDRVDPAILAMLRFKEDKKSRSLSEYKVIERAKWPVDLEALKMRKTSRKA